MSSSDKGVQESTPTQAERKPTSDAVPFYVLEQQEREKASCRPLKKRLYPFSASGLDIQIKNQNIQAQFMMIAWFVRASRVVLGRFVDLLEQLKAEYLNEIRAQKCALQTLLQTSIQQFSYRTR